MYILSLIAVMASVFFLCVGNKEMAFYFLGIAIFLILTAIYVSLPGEDIHLEQDFEDLKAQKGRVDK